MAFVPHHHQNCWGRRWVCAPLMLPPLPPRPAPSHGQPDPQPPFSTVMVQGVPQLSSGLAEHGIFQVGQVWRDLAL